MNPNDHWTVVERIIIAVVGGLPATIAALTAFVVALRAYRQAMVTYRKVDSRMDQLLEEAKSRARLEGSLEAQAAVTGTFTQPLPPTRVERGYPIGPNPDLPPPK